MKQQSSLIIFQVINAGTIFILFYFIINDWKNRLAVKFARFAADCVLFQVVESQANKEKLQEHPLMSFRAAENKIMHLGVDIPNYISRTWVMTQEGDPEVMEITSLKAFIVVAAGPQSTKTC